MSRFTDRVERDLAQIAEQATPSSTAWEAIQQRIGEQETTDSTMGVIMLAPNPKTSWIKDRPWLLGAAAAVVIALIVGVFIATSGDDGPGVIAEQPDSDTETVPDDEQGAESPMFATGTSPGDVLFDGTDIWVANNLDNTVSRFAPVDGTRVDFDTGQFPVELAFDGSRLWVIEVFDGTVSTIDPADGTRTVVPFEFEGADVSALTPEDLIFDGASIWVTHGDERGETYVLSQVNPADGTRVDYPFDTYPGLPVSDGTDLWFVNDESAIVRFDPAGQAGDGVEYEIAGEPRSALFADGSIWVVYWEGNVISKVELADGARVDFDGGQEPAALAFDGTSIWVTNRIDGTVSHIDPADGTRVDYPVGAIPEGVAFDGTSVWVASTTDNTVTVITPE